MNVRRPIIQSPRRCGQWASAGLRDRTPSVPWVTPKPARSWPSRCAG